ncbi:TolB family protein [Tengunoibacter tsumagoiensis]|uniref:Lipoprotein LpqB beta-propeller domain-containing protein n=1 Tax=Tengunoibacter tsumagoiensis TaxID=2014871 RepID=A0A401ZZY5_9CHLR|nr:hypothetical protein [Tengunoibacter tsumagoiensis]GCE12438.1 hypothetical protein KTT_22970 [Tengunoibacter tsumagoiensis]
MKFPPNRNLNIMAFSMITCLFFFFTACAQQPSEGGSGISGLPTSVATPQTNCPAEHVARAAIMPELAAGKKQNLVYVYNHGFTASTLRRYEPATKSKTDILSVPNGSIYDAIVSPDGAWVLFSIQMDGQSGSQIQLVRIDGLYRQTLSCIQFIPGQLQFSPDQKMIAFTGEGAGAGIYSLNIATGGPIVTTFGYLHIVDWADNTHVYAASIPHQSVKPPTLMLVDITQANKTTDMDKPDTACIQYAFSLDKKQLFRVTCTLNDANEITGPSTISVKPVNGGSFHTIYTVADGSIGKIHAIADKTLLLYGKALFGRHNETNAGFWKIDTDGRNPTLLLDTGAAQQPDFDGIAQWSIVSRDGTHFAGTVLDADGVTTKIFVQLLSSDHSTLDASIEIASVASSAGDISIAGWTTV